MFRISTASLAHNNASPRIFIERFVLTKCFNVLIFKHIIDAYLSPAPALVPLESSLASIAETLASQYVFYYPLSSLNRQLILQQKPILLVTNTSTFAPYSPPVPVRFSKTTPAFSTPILRSPCNGTNGYTICALSLSLS